MNRPHISSFTFLFLCFLLYLHISPNIEAQQFGKNKVQYQSFDWKIIKTKHFDVYFAEEGEYLARYAGIIADLEKANKLWEIEKKACKKTGFKAWYITTDPKKANSRSIQLSLF